MIPDLTLKVASLVDVICPALFQIFHDDVPSFHDHSYCYEDGWLYIDTYLTEQLINRPTSEWISITYYTKTGDVAFKNTFNVQPPVLHLVEGSWMDTDGILSATYKYKVTDSFWKV